MKRLRLIGTTLALATACATVLAPAAGAHQVRHHQWYGGRGHHASSSSLGATTVTTAPGVATALVGSGILPLPELPRTGFGVSFRHGLQVSYTFPIVKNTANLTSGTGDIDHAGGIVFVSRRASLEVGRFDIDLAAGKVFATRVNGDTARIPLLDLDLSGLTVGTGPGGSTVLSGITAKLDGAAATALNSTFGSKLPTDGSLTFGTARVVIR